MSEHKILIVEDEQIVAEDIRELLESMNLQICGQSMSGQDAVDKALSLEPDLILMDVVLQGDMDGLEAAEIISEKADIPIIFLTAYSDEKILSRVKKIGAYGYLVKPFDEENFKTTVEVSLFKAQGQRELEAQNKLLEDIVCRRTDSLRLSNTELQGEILERKKAEDHLSQQIYLEKVINKLSYNFLGSNHNSLERAVCANLGILANETAFNWVALLGMEEGDTAVTIPYQSIIPDGYWSLYELLTESASALSGHLSDSTGELVYNSNLECIDGISPELKKVLDPLAFSNIVILPVFVEIGPSYWLLFATKNKTDRIDNSYIETLNIASRFFASSLQHHHTHMETETLKTQLHQAQKMEAIGKFSGGIAHDFNNLLVPIMGYTDMLMDELKGHGTVLDDLNEIKKAAHSASSLSRQMLAFSRKQLVKKESINLNDLIYDMKNMLTRLIGENIKLTFKAPPAPLYISSDAGQIQQILMNLVVNSRDAMPKGGEITIDLFDIRPENWPQVKEVDNYVYISVKDTGEGIPAKNLEEIFDPFFSTKGSDGTGLGLSVVYGLIQQHNGMIKVESVVGEGTCFCVRFARDFSSDKKPAMHSGENMLESLRGMHVLLVEDDPGVLRLVQKTFEGAGLEVDAVTNFKDANKKIETNLDAYGLVFSDAVLPGGHGLDLLQKALEKRPEIKVVLCSGYTNRRSLFDKAREQEIKFLQKPFSIKDLRKTVSDLFLNELNR